MHVVLKSELLNWDIWLHILTYANNSFSFSGGSKPVVY